MAMQRAEDVRLAADRAYAKEHCDTATLHLMESLERNNAQLEAEVDAQMSLPRLLTGRRVFGGAVAVALLLVQGLLLVSWLDARNDEWSWRNVVNSGFHAMEVRLGMETVPRAPVQPPAPAQHTANVANATTTPGVTP